MVGYLALGHNQFERARWIPQGEHSANNSPKLIRVEQVREKTKAWVNPAGNILAASNNTYVSTYFQADYAINDYIYWRGAVWGIDEITESIYDIAPQALSWVKARGRKIYVLKLYETNVTLEGITR